MRAGPGPARRTGGLTAATRLRPPDPPRCSPSAREANVKAIVFGATGMIGQGVLRECLLDPDVMAVLTVGRSATGQQHPKLRELVVADLTDYSAVQGELS